MKSGKMVRNFFFFDYFPNVLLEIISFYRKRKKIKIIFFNKTIF